MAAPYGVDIYEAIRDVTSDPFVARQLSLPTTVNAGTYLVTAYELANAAGPGTDVEGILNLALDLAFDIAAEIAGEIIEGVIEVVGDLLPVLFAFLDAMMSIASSMQEQEKAERAQAAMEGLRECQDTADRFHPIPTGTDGSHKPSDFFQQAERTGFDAQGAPTWRVGTVPFIGRMLGLITEQTWGNWYLSIVDDPARLMGVPPAIYQRLGGLENLTETERWCQGTWWPPIQRYVPLFSRLRRAIQSQSIASRQARGLTAGDGGSAVWPLYMDLLFGAVRVSAWPLNTVYGDGYDYAGEGFRQVPPLSEEVIRAFYGRGQFGTRMGWPNLVGFAAQLDELTQGGPHDVTVGCHGRPWPYAGAVESFGERNSAGDWVSACRGDPKAAIDAILGIVDSWGNSVRPIYADDQRAQELAIRRALDAASVATRARIQALGLALPHEGPRRAGEAIERLSRMGLLGDDAAAGVAEKANGGAGAGVAVLAAGALLALRMKRR